jgi:hypothetical protein
MTFHLDQQYTINRWLSEHLAGGCPSCGTPDWWQPHDRLYNLSSPSPGTSGPGSDLELVVVTCKHCAFTAQYLAKQMGL